MERKDRLSFADTLNQILAAIKGSDVMRNGGFAASQESFPQRLPPRVPLDQQQGMPDPMQQPQGQPDISALMGGPQMQQSRPPMRDEGAMDRMMMAIAQPYMEGPNMNITDDTRDRAMAWLRAQQGG